MRPRHGFAFAVFAMTAAVLLPVPSPGQEAYDTDDREDWEPGQIRNWKKLLTTADWEMDDDCQKVKEYALDAIGRADGSITGGQRMYLYWGVPKEAGSTKGGSYGSGLNDSTESFIIINDTLDNNVGGAGKWEAFLHEAAHHAGYSADHSESWNAYDAQECAEIVLDEDENGGGGGSTGGDSGMWIWVPETSFEVCESYTESGSPCELVQGDNPDGSGSHYHCGNISNWQTVCWHEIVEPGHWVWMEL